MSSTSSDVYELWSGGGVFWVLGSPVLLQLICIEQPVPDHDARTYTFRDATKRGFYREKGDIKAVVPTETATDAEVYSDIENLRARQNPPNLLSNVSIKFLSY